jgi:transcriptional regulator with GAF, ATPase, and Fis domain
VIHVDVRVLAATNKDLDKEVQSGGFREDLFFRLDVFPIRVPALRERRVDVPLMAAAFVAAFCRENGLREKQIEPGVYEALARRKFPGNVRELKNVVERAAILSSDVITIADLPEDPHLSPFDDELELEDAATTTPLPLAPPKTPGAQLTLREFREGAERTDIIDTLKALDWNISKTGSSAPTCTRRFALTASNAATYERAQAAAGLTDGRRRR